MRIKEAIKSLKLSFKRYSSLWYLGFLLFVLGCVISIISNFTLSDLTHDVFVTIGICISIGAIIGVYSGTVLDFYLVWIIPLLVNLFVGAHLSYWLGGVSGALLASFIAPIIGSMMGYYFYIRRKNIDDHRGYNRLDAEKILQKLNE